MIYIVLGTVIVLFTIREVFHAVFVPGEYGQWRRLAPSLVRDILWPFYRGMEAYFPDYLQAEMLGLFAPLVGVFMLLIWVSSLTVGFGLVLYGLGNDINPTLDSPFTAMYVAGSSILTLGYGDYVGKTTAVRFLMLGAALNGLIITASVICLIFTLLNGIQGREMKVSMLCAGGGSPPSGIALLEANSHAQTSTLTAHFRDWQAWCHEVLCTHTAYPILLYFRCAGPSNSWLTALGAALDSAALFLSMHPGPEGLPARAMMESALALIDELCTMWKLSPTESDGITDEELDMLEQRVSRCGYDMPAGSRERFLLLRKYYVSKHRALCRYLVVAQTPVISQHEFKITVDTSQP